MKYLYCTLCNDLVTPGRNTNQPRTCQCGRFLAWWESDGTFLRIRDTNGYNSGAEVMGIHNGIFELKLPLTAESVRRLLDSIPSDYLFHTARSLVVRFTVGETTDTGWDGQPRSKPDADSFF